MANGLMEYDLVINNGKLVIPPDIISSSIGVKGEKIAAIATDLSGFPAKKTIDAKATTFSQASWTRKRILAFTVLWKTILSLKPKRPLRGELPHGA